MFLWWPLLQALLGFGRRTLAVASLFISHPLSSLLLLTIFSPFHLPLCVFLELAPPLLPCLSVCPSIHQPVSVCFVSPSLPTSVWATDIHTIRAGQARGVGALRLASTTHGPPSRRSESRPSCMTVPSPDLAAIRRFRGREGEREREDKGKKKKVEGRLVH